MQHQLQAQSAQSELTFDKFLGPTLNKLNVHSQGLWHHRSGQKVPLEHEVLQHILPVVGTKTRRSRLMLAKMAHGLTAQ